MQCMSCNMQCCAQVVKVRNESGRRLRPVAPIMTHDSHNNNQLTCIPRAYYVVFTVIYVLLIRLKQLIVGYPSGRPRHQGISMQAGGMLRT